MDVRISSMTVCSFSSVLPFNARKKNHIIWPWAQSLTVCQYVKDILHTSNIVWEKVDFYFSEFSQKSETYLLPPLPDPKQRKVSSKDANHAHVD